MGFIELLGAALAAIVGAFFYGKKKARDDQRAKDAKSNLDTRRKIDEAIENVGDDPAAARRLLAERGRR